MNFWRRSAGTFEILKVRNGIIREKMKVTQKFPERIKNNSPPQYWYVLGFEDRWPKRKLIWSPEGRNKRRRPETK